MVCRINGLKDGKDLYSYDRELSQDELKDREILEHILSLYPEP